MPTFMKHIPYLSSLPVDDELLTPLYFTPDELELLSGTNMYGAVLDKRKELEAEFRAVQGILEGIKWYALADDFLVASHF